LYDIKTCAIDIHHHYVPNAPEEAKKRGQHGVIYGTRRQPFALFAAPAVLTPSELPAIDAL
jgi:hypothetical protein